MGRPMQSPDKRAALAPQLDVQPQTGSLQDGTSRLDLIARRAYERFEMRGGEHGRDQEDWFDAERELNQDPPK
jgi:hypothetical protein